MPIVYTGGGVILDNDTQLLLPAGVHLTCGATSPSNGAPNDYRIFQKNDSTIGLNISDAIVINPLLLVQGTTFQAPIQLPGTGSAFTDCLVVAGNKDGSGNVVDQFAPSVWYPKCIPGTDCVDDNDGSDVYIRSAIQEYSAFNPNPSVAYPGGGPAAKSTAILIGTPNGDGTYSGGSNTTIRNVTVVGFGTCYGVKARGARLEDCGGDCHTGFDMKTPDAPRIRDCSIGPLLTQSAPEERIPGR